jgi:hypothetical protein
MIPDAAKSLEVPDNNRTGCGGSAAAAFGAHRRRTGHDGALLQGVCIECWSAI